MKLEVHDSILRARVILTQIETLGKLTKYNQVDVYLKHYSNGREQGFYLGDIAADIGVVFAECRGSDEIVVVWGSATKFNSQGMMPANELWDQNCRYFLDANGVQVAKFILDKLLDARKAYNAQKRKEKAKA